MLAFIKRRWILLSCAALLTGSAMIDLRYAKEIVLPRGMTVFVRGGTMPRSITVRFFGIYQGYFMLVHQEYPGTGAPNWICEMHFPQLGRLLLPRFDWRDDYRVVAIPLWLPLAIVLGWLCFRELRWREKQA